MIKIPFSLLEGARTNPQELANKLLSKNTNYRRRKSIFQYWKNAAIKYHKSINHDIDITIDNLTCSLRDNFKSLKNNPKALLNYSDKLRLYIEDHHRNGFNFIESIYRTRIQINNSQVVISGQIPIVNRIDNDTYGIIFFTKEESLWEQELKYPLLQYHFSKKIYKCDLSQIFVGVYSFEDDRHYIQSFDRHTIILALNEVADIASTIEAELSEN